MAIFVCEKSKAELFIFSILHFDFAFSSCQDEKLFMSKRWVRVIFRRHQRIRDLPDGFRRLRLFRIVSNYSPESFTLLARFLERRISIVFFVKAK